MLLLHLLAPFQQLSIQCVIHPVISYSLVIIAGHSYFIHEISTYYSYKCEIKNINVRIYLLLPNN